MLIRIWRMQSRFAHLLTRFLPVFYRSSNGDTSNNSSRNTCAVTALPRTIGTLHNHQLRGDASKVMIPDLLPVSAVIATQNRAASLTRMLSSLRQHATLPAEIVVIDASDDVTANSKLLTGWRKN